MFRTQTYITRSISDKLSKTSSSVMVTTLVVSILAKFSVASADRSVIVYTTELYPTVIRLLCYQVINPFRTILNFERKF
jgi:hypothetical protein